MRESGDLSNKLVTAKAYFSRYKKRVSEHTVQLVPVQMLCARVALAAALVRTFKLLVEAFSAPPSLARRTRCLAAIVAVIVLAIHLVSVAPASSVVVAVGRCRRRRLDGAAARVHLLGEISLNLAKVRRVPCMH